MTLKKKKILIVSRTFYPVNAPRSFRTTELVKEFSRQGHDVSLLIPKNDEFHIPFENEHNVTIKDLGKPSLPSINLKKGNKASYFMKRVFRRGLLMFFEYPDIEWMFKVRRALKKESSYDMLITIAAPHTVHWGTALAWRNKNPIADTWIADCGDPYMLATLDSFKKLFYFKYFEKYFCRKADYITVPIEGAKKGYYPEFRDKIRVIPQGFDFNGVEINKNHFESNRVPTFAYAGGLIPGGRDPSEFLEYLTNQDKPYKFILYTQSRSLVNPYVKKSGGNIEIRDYIPREELLQLLSRMDFLVNIENSTSLQKPSKLIDYYLTKRPVLNIGSRDIDTEAVDQFLDGDYQNRLKFTNVEQYRIDRVCKQFLDLSEG